MNFFEFVAEEVREILAELGFRTHRRGDRPRRAARHPRRDRPLEGRGARPRPILHGPSSTTTPPLRNLDRPGPRAGQRPRPAPDRHGGRALSDRHAGEDLARTPSATRPLRRHHARPRGHARRYGSDGLPDGHHRHHASTAPPARASGRSCRPASRCAWTATPTTTSARVCPAGASSSGPTAPTRSRPSTTSSPAT